MEIIRDIEPTAYPVDGEELFNKIVKELIGLVVFDKDDTVLPAGAVRGQFVTGVDWLPTVAELAGVELPAGVIDGRSVSRARS